ncbi:hypothetical protein BB934_27670 (plasmid) [Microvirga ossetica]|uniref:Uncharacterized protein n=1 Tax=Microvirga ossetica TaxID=1882682 RepID=A0A1B2EQB3_9HYPH|nr:hypothetical protein BB934_27670 [Microvirga ossetica]
MEHDRDVNAADNIKRLGIVALRAGGHYAPVYGGLRQTIYRIAAAIEQKAWQREPSESSLFTTRSRHREEKETAPKGPILRPPRATKRDLRRSFLQPLMP